VIFRHLLVWQGHLSQHLRTTVTRLWFINYPMTVEVLSHTKICWF
jgi:hypothetical protein